MNGKRTSNAVGGIWGRMSLEAFDMEFDYISCRIYSQGVVDKIHTSLRQRSKNTPRNKTVKVIK